ncbi:MAG TPA: hypothetical protein VFS24_06040 [Steroidobacteraceae bacterium]|nr:hypothetical protein [Steroidobacteraceae bacterium]
MTVRRAALKSAIVLGLCVATCGSAFAADTHAAATQATAVSSKLSATQAALRDLWIGHIFWVREVVRNLAANDAADAKLAEQQVVANAKQIAGAIAPFYGQAASDQLFKLLAGHYGAVKAHAQATIAKDANGAKTAIEQLTSNAGEIASFLSGANPYLPKDTLMGLLSAHGAHHVQQNQQIAAKDWASEAKTWDAMKNHMYVIADALGAGIAKQFPDKF